MLSAVPGSSRSPANGCALRWPWIWAAHSYLALGDNGAGSWGVSWPASCGEQLGELIYDAQASDKVLALQQSIHSFLLLVFHNILGLHRVVLQAL